MAAPATRLTPPEVAKVLRVDPSKILAWIRSGELRAVNVATRGSQRPRWRIDPVDLAAFENSRAVTPKAPCRRRKTASAGVVPYF